MGQHRLSALFDPRSIAVFGASDRENSVAGRVYRNLTEGGFEGSVFAVNPKHSTVHGMPCHASLDEVPEAVDLAVIASPARTVREIIEQCGARGVRHALIVTAGFGETGETGRAAERGLLEAARRHGIRFIGPNCVGLVRPWREMNASFLTTGTPRGKLALVSQSGALCSAISDWAGPNHLGFSALMSLGNSVDIGFGDALSFLASDPKTEAVLLYVEGVRHARPFISELRAAAQNKPVVVLKAGRHARSSAAASTHSGALVGSDAVFDAVLERAGAVRAMTFGQLFAAAEMLSAYRRAGGNRLCIITNGGGAGVLAADRAEDLGVSVVPPSTGTREKLDGFLPAYWSHANPVDILGDAPPEAFGRATAACLEDPAFDGVLVMLTPQAMTEPLEAAQQVLSAAQNARKPVLACWMGETSVRSARQLLSSSGIADFTTPERAVEAFSYLARHEQNQRLSLEIPGPQLFRDSQDAVGARMIVESALSEGRSMLSDIESKAILRAFGIAVGTTLEADTAAKALTAAETLGFPVAMKINSPDISHKSDVGGVKTDIARAAEVRPAFHELLERARLMAPGAKILGATVERMVAIEHARELLIGVTRDPVFGPTIVFGAGGTSVEVLQDSAVALPPLTTVLARQLIERTRVARLLDASRNRPAANRELIVEVLLRVSDLVAELPEIVELDINPLFAGPESAIAVDARIRIARRTGTTAPHQHMAIAPYPRHLVEQSFLSDGTALTIRPIRPEDAESSQEFVRGLSPEARRLRFFQALKELSPAMLARFTQIDYAREMALVATVEADGGRERQVGVARYVLNPDGGTCEFAIVVSNEVQGRGIGTRLLQALIRAAREHCVEIMQGLVLADNAPMLQLMREFGFSVAASVEDTSLVTVERRI
jgi:acetyltransferase